MIKDLPPRPSRKRRPDKGGGNVGTARPQGSLFVAAVCFACFPFGVVAGVAAFLLHGYGVI